MSPGVCLVREGGQTDRGGWKEKRSVFRQDKRRGLRGLYGSEPRCTQRGDGDISALFSTQTSFIILDAGEMLLETNANQAGGDTDYLL